MRIAYYERNGGAADVLKLETIDDPRPGSGEVRVRLRTSGVNPSDVKTRAGLTRKMMFPRVVPHSDGAGDIDMVGDGVPGSRVGERVWIWNGQWKRPNGTAAEYIVLHGNPDVILCLRGLRGGESTRFLRYAPDIGAIPVLKFRARVRHAFEDVQRRDPSEARRTAKTAVPGRLSASRNPFSVPMTKIAVSRASAVAASPAMTVTDSRPSAGRPVRGFRMWP